MAFIRERISEDGTKSYMVVFRNSQGKERSTGTWPRKGDAQRAKKLLEADLIRGVWHDPKLAKTNFGDYAVAVEAAWPKRRPNTRIRDEASLRNHVLPAFNSHDVGSVKPKDARSWIASLEAKGLAPATARKAYGIFKRIMATAVDDGLIPESPCRNIELPRVEQAEMRILDPDEIRWLAETIHPKYSVMVLAAGYIGLRFGEMAALRIDRFNALRKTIRVDSNLVEVGGEFTSGPPKSKASVRSVSIPQFLVEEIAAYIATHRDPSGLVFSAPEGGPIRRTNFRRRIWTPAVDGSVGPPCSFHSLRHSHVAMLIDQGAHPRLIQARLGHSNFSTTMNVYGSLFDGVDEAVAETLDAVFSDSAADKMLTPAKVYDNAMGGG